MIIAVTGNILPEDVREYADAGANDVLIKPLKIEKLEETLESK
jgi:CheY-like chemotaxis protein